MSGLTAIALAVLVFAAISPAFRAGMPRLIFLTLIAGFGFWYWLPALNLVTVGYIGLDNFYITSTVNNACWLVLISQVSALGLLWLTRPLFAGQTATPEKRIPALMLTQLSLGSAVAYLAVRFASHDISILNELWTAQVSGRSETSSFANRSEGAVQSLLALWEIISIWIALFCLGWHVSERRLLTPSGISAMSALTIMFVSSGTRAVLLQALFVGIVTALARPSRAIARPFSRRLISSSTVRLIVYSLPAAALGTAIALGFKSRFASDGGYSVAGPMAIVAGTLFVNNDMMRELAFVMDTMRPSLQGAGDFLLTPFAFLMPTFFGFHKEFPAHLVLYNYLRAGIDLEFGVGNVFPGLVADFWLLFGYWAPVILAGFLTIFAIALERLSRIVPNTRALLIYQVVSLSYLFFSFRNITGALGLTLVFGVAILWSCASPRISISSLSRSISTRASGSPRSR